MSQRERTVEGIERYYQTREKATELARHVANRKFTEVELRDLLTGFALDERRRWEQVPPTGAEQEATANRVFETTQDTDYQCFTKARAKGEPIFTLRAQDMTAADLVREWVRRNARTCRPEKLADALSIAQAMDRWSSKKEAD